MRISAKGRYALAAAVTLAQAYGGGACVTVISISEKLGISKIYLEQVFALLKRGGVVSSLKGSQGGYMLSRAPGEITAYDVLLSVETSLFQEAEATVWEKEPQLDAALGSLVFGPLDVAVKAALAQVTLEALAQETQKRQADQALMYFI